MPAPPPADTEEPSEEILDFTGFTVKKTGLVQSQTALKVDEYMINASLYQLSAKGLSLLAALSKQETALFQKYEGTMAGVSLAFQPQNEKRPIRLFFRCLVSRFAAMEGRDDLVLIRAEIKACPEDLKAIIHEYSLVIGWLKADFERGKGQAIRISLESAKLLGFNNYAELHAGATRSEVAIFSIASDRIEFLFPKAPRDFEAGEKLTLRLFFQLHQFFVKGIVSSQERIGSGVLRADMEVEFSPELVEILAKYRESNRSR
jgi:hypothetical protein